MAYDLVVGNPAISGLYTNPTKTIIDLEVPASISTTLKKAFAYCYDSGSSNKIKIFRDDGTNYNFIGEVAFTGSDGLNEIDMNLPIQSGDLIGYYCSSGIGCIVASSGGVGGVSRIGDITTNSAKSLWNSISNRNSLNAGYYYDYYVKVGGNDSLDGKSWTNAWATVDKGATTVPDGETLHIGFGDYTAEPTPNKIAPQNVGATGITYHCETATTGGGTGTVSVEQN